MRTAKKRTQEVFDVNYYPIMVHVT